MREVTLSMMRCAKSIVKDGKRFVQFENLDGSDPQELLYCEETERDKADFFVEGETYALVLQKLQQ